jgi:hypothetical protein
LNQIEGDPPVYESRFVASQGGGCDIYLSFADFVAVRRGQHLRYAPAFDKSKIRALGFLISDKQYGPFSISIDEIGLY